MTDDEIRIFMDKMRNEIIPISKDMNYGDLINWLNGYKECRDNINKIIISANTKSDILKEIDNPFILNIPQKIKYRELINWCNGYLESKNNALQIIKSIQKGLKE